MWWVDIYIYIYNKINFCEPGEWFWTYFRWSDYSILLPLIWIGYLSFLFNYRNYFYIPDMRFLNIFLIKILFIYFLERGREGEKHQYVVASCVPPTGDLACTPGMCPRLGIEPVTLWFSGQGSINWATPARAEYKVFFIRYIIDNIFSDDLPAY